MVASPAIPGLFFCFAATVLLIFVCVSTPTWDTIYFLKAGDGADEVRYGVFGYTGSDVGIGYDFLEPGETNLNTSVIHNLTKALIVHPIACGLAGLAFLFGLCGASYHRIGTIFMTLLTSLAALACLVAFVIDMVLFGITRSRLRDADIPAQYGNANWLTLGALVALSIGFCASACGVFGRYRKRKENY